MKISKVWHFYGERYVPSEVPMTPFELTTELLEELSHDWDVMIHHLYDPHKDRVEYALALDAPSRKFRQR